jgi:hypothetical protein
LGPPRVASTPKTTLIPPRVNPKTTDPDRKRQFDTFVEALHKKVQKEGIQLPDDVDYEAMFQKTLDLLEAKKNKEKPNNLLQNSNSEPSHTPNATLTSSRVIPETTAMGREQQFITFIETLQEKILRERIPIPDDLDYEALFQDTNFTWEKFASSRLA